MNAEIIDTHCHLNMVQQAGVSLEEAFANAKAAGVTSAVLIAVDEESARYHADLVQKKSTPGLQLLWTAGLHPEGADNISGLQTLFAFVRESRDRLDFLGIGETGLDYYHSTEFVNNQKESFRGHLELSVELQLPIIVHLRDSQKFEPGKIQSVDDAEAMVRETKARGVLHCFTYGYEEAMRFVDMGWFISFSGILTYKNAQIIQDAAARLPLECILVETDAPFLTPNPVRGKPNQPAYTAHTAKFLADLRSKANGEDPDHILAQIHQNSERFFALKK